MPISPTVLDDLESLTSSTFEKIKEFHFKPDATMTGLRHLRDKARNEKNLRDLYRGRALYELLQNADDCGASTVTLFLTSDGLAFAHDGRWFTVRNFINLADGWSDKDPNQCIGHKGLGFRSVLDITPSPHLVKVSREEFLAIKFSWALNQNFIQNVVKGSERLKHEYQEWTKHGERVCPIMYIPNTVKKTSLGSCSRVLDKLLSGEHGDSYSTLFWLPSEDDSITPPVLKELDPAPLRLDDGSRTSLISFLTEEVTTILPFLKSITSVILCDTSGVLGNVVLKGRMEENAAGLVQMSMTVGAHESETWFYELRRSVRIPSDIRTAQGTPKAVAKMDCVTLALSVRINQERPMSDKEAFFHVYFPTTDPTGLGFVLHTDFFVQPDRTRLIQCRYNEWLMEQAAKLAANDLLTLLMQHYKPSDVFSSLLPHGQNSTSNHLVESFVKELRARQKPFVPTSSGLVARENVVVPPRIDKTGFWKEHFLPDPVNNDPLKDFLLPSEDGDGTRAFLRLASIEPLQVYRLLEFIEGSFEGRTADWWFDCLSALAMDPYFSTKESKDFHDRKLLFLQDAQVTKCTLGEGKIICLPPSDMKRLSIVPRAFSRHFGFLQPELSELLAKAGENVREWTKRCLVISEFEASDLLPRLSAKIAPEIFAHPADASVSELVEIWTFIKAMLDASGSRQVQSERVWENIGRLPVVIQSPEAKGLLVPAFLTYFPDQLLPENSPIRGVGVLQRLDPKFLESIMQEGPIAQQECVALFRQAGVKDHLTAREYHPVVAGGDPDFQLLDPIHPHPDLVFTGERQHDENRVALQMLTRGNLWHNYLAASRLCSHPGPRVIRNFTVIEGFEDSVAQSLHEAQESPDRWVQKLLELTSDVVPIVDQQSGGASALCRGGNGHEIQLPSLVRFQINQLPWIPTSLGPRRIDQSFSRLSQHRLISSGSSGQELGDKILPYVVLENVERQLDFQRLDVQPLENAQTARPRDLLLALSIAGQRLSEEWSRSNILQDKSSWRLVRGAIQEIYRRLNQDPVEPDDPGSLSLACRKPSETGFASGKIYFAEPGSSIERAFTGRLNLLDADRPYPAFFKAVGISRLQPGLTVNEALKVGGQKIDSCELKDDIVDNLGPYLLALIIAKSEKSKHAELVMRRLRERFVVHIVNDLSVTYSLTEDSTVEALVPISRFYLQTRIVPGTGAIEEKTFCLYVVGNQGVTLFDLDADDLGQRIAPIFADENDEIAAMFPRIAARYRQAKGQSSEMDDFMLHQLGVSVESLDFARALIAGEVFEKKELGGVPPTTWVQTGPGTSSSADAQQKLQDLIEQQKKDLIATITSALEQTLAAGTKEDPPSDQGTQKPGGGPSPKQEERGTKGEEEIKRRMTASNDGWEGFTLVKDRRGDKCGYDFLCRYEGIDVEMEVKTFAPNGRIIFDQKELRTAAASGERYFLVGVLDSAEPTYCWRTFSARDPFGLLFEHGHFTTDIKLEVSPADVFDLGGTADPL